MVGIFAYLFPIIVLFPTTMEVVMSSLPLQAALYRELVYDNFVNQYINQGMTEEQASQEAEKATEQHLESIGD